jgi:zinc transport system substrate-binding protein
LDQSAAAIGVKIGQKPLLASHSFMEYFARRYSLNMISLHWFHASMPDAEHWQELEAALAEHPAQWMIWEAQPVSTVVTKLKGLGIDSTVFDPCYSESPDGDFIIAMKKNMKNLQRIAQEP